MLCICRPRIKVVCCPHYLSDKGWVTHPMVLVTPCLGRFISLCESKRLVLFSALPRVRISGPLFKTPQAVDEAGSHILDPRGPFRNMTSTMVSLPPSATPTLVTTQLTFLPPALLTPSVEYQQTSRPESAQAPMANLPPMPVHSSKPSVNITFLLLSGKRKTMRFDPEYTIGKVRQEVFGDWPEGACSCLYRPFHNSVIL